MAARSCWFCSRISRNKRLMVRLVAHGRDVTLLTNFAPDTFDEARKRYPFLASARGATVSGQIGKVKPDAEIFHHHQGHFDLNPDTTLFIDDKVTP